MEKLVQAIEGGAINTWIISSAWTWPLLEIIHFVGLSLLLGSMVIIDLRLAGYLRRIGITVLHRLLPYAAIGFCMNLVTGTLFFMGDPARYSVNIGFLWKMALIVVAGLNALWFAWKINPVMRTWDAHGDTSALARVIAFVSLGTWLGVLLLGRLIPYVGTG